MSSAKSVYKLGCSCGANSFSLKGQPVMRAVCHCHFCQDYNQAAYGDFLVYRATQLEEDVTAESQYKSYSKPPLVKRGSCTQCGKPVMEKASIPLFPKLLFVPVVNHPDKANLPAPVMQMFSHRRIEDPGTHIPSYTGYVSSETVFLWKLARSL